MELLCLMHYKLMKTFYFSNVGLQIIYKNLQTLILSNCKALKELPNDIGKLLK
jgi:hypothetical protein